METKLNKTQEEIITLTGTDNWGQVVEWFTGNVAEKVEAIWPGDPNNDKLVKMIESQL
jgi:hypothetical protein